MSESVQPHVTTSYPHGEVAVITAPLNTPMALDTLLGGSNTVAAMQAQLDALTARVAALEAAQP